MKFKAVVFDMDGVMFDTESVCMKSWDTVGEEMGIGKAVFKFAVRKMPEMAKSLMTQMHCTEADIDWFITHQANERIIEAIAKRLKSDIAKFPMNIAECGNTSSASIPILLDEMNRSGQLKDGQKIIMAGFGAGLSWGAVYMEWHA